MGDSSTFFLVFGTVDSYYNTPLAAFDTREAAERYVDAVKNGDELTANGGRMDDYGEEYAVYIREWELRSEYPVPSDTPIKEKE